MQILDKLGCYRHDQQARRKDQAGPVQGHLAAVFNRIGHPGYKECHQNRRDQQCLELVKVLQLKPGQFIVFQKRSFGQEQF